MCISLSQQNGLNELSDRVLMEQTCAGNQTAFEILVKRYQETLYRFAMQRVDSELAYDVMQFVWLQFYLSMPSLLQRPAILQDHSSLKAWLFCITKNRCIDEMRRRRKRPYLFSELYTSNEEEELLHDLLDGEPQPEEQVELYDVRIRLRDAIATLPPKYRAIVWLRYTQELSFSEIGHKLHMPPNTAKTYFHRARPLLCTALSSVLSA